ncbi:MAG: hypothetical protein ACRDTC_14590 [Pseudonocardiaceae bacterium]
MSDPALYEWLALRRVHDGGVARSAGAYFDHGRPTPGHLTEVFDRLVWTGLVAVLVVPPPEFSTTQTPVGRRFEPLPPAPGDRSGPT